ncbi:MAG TPA: right-handed parallel beta-helix repeat-containing protein, partial [Sedimentisphaerales bacterium]|nr:right-handed parallel beta-helix repeat-containing protein [Sedimentisphaerales bacterium]
MKKEIILAVIFLSLAACWAEGRVFISNTTSPAGRVPGGGPFTTIQEALDVARDAVPNMGVDPALAAIVDAPYILVDAAGSPYYGPGNTNLQMWVPKTLLAINSAEGRRAELGEVVIDGEGTSRAFLFLQGQNLLDPNAPADVNDGFIVSGFWIQNGFASEFADPPGIINRGCGGGMLIDAGFPIIENCMFTSCYADFAGGGLAIGAGEGGVGGDDVPLIRNSIFFNNAAWFSGGGIAVRGGGAPNIINCLIVQNYADTGGGIYVEASLPNIELSTIADNSGFYGVYVFDAAPTFVNSILWGNGGGDSDLIVATNCLVEDEDISGADMLYSDPQFTAGMYRMFWGDAGNYYVQSTSPTIDAGTGTLANPYNSDYGISVSRVTRVDEVIDRFAVDLGFHYPLYTGPDVPATLTITIIGDPSRGRVEISSLENRFGEEQDPPPYDASNVYKLLLGDRVELMAVPAPGYRVKQWTNTNDDGIFDLDHLFRNVFMFAEDVGVSIEFEPDVPSTLNFPGQYADLQYAVNIARSGDTIIIHPGVYVLPGAGAYISPTAGLLATPVVTVRRKAITIRSVAPDDPATVAATVIEPGWGAWDVFRFEEVGRDTVLSGITIRNADMFGADGLDGSTDNPRRPRGEDGQYAYGAGIQIRNASPTILNSVFLNCQVVGGNGGDGIAIDNLGYDGGHGGSAGGAAAFILYGSPLFRNTIFSGNSAVAGSGGNGAEGDDRFGRGGSYRIWASSFGGDGQRIEHQGAGGAVLVVGGHAEFEDSTFEQNTVSSGNSGTGSSPIVVTDMSSAGGAVHIGGNMHLGQVGGSASFTRCVFIGNSPRLVSNAVFESPYIAYGGAISFSENSSVTIIDSTFTNNAASLGGAVHWAVRSQAAGHTLIEGTTFRENQAFQGGGIYGHGGSASLLNNVFIGNTALLEPAAGVLMQGGAAYLSSVDLLLGDSVFHANQSTHSGGAIAIVGYNQADRLPPRVHNNLFLGNTTGRDGGAIVVSDGAEPNIVNCTMVNNVAAGSGGGISVTTGSRAVIENCLFWVNTAPSGSQISLINPGGVVGDGGRATVSHSMIQGGQGGIAATPGGFLTYEASNIHTGDPGFVHNHVTHPDQFIYDYSLINNSPCVDAGSIDLEMRPASGTQPVLPLGRYAYTIRTDGYRDTGMIDIGFHRRKVGEYPPGDIDYSGVVDAGDLVLIEYWL